MLALVQHKLGACEALYGACAALVQPQTRRVRGFEGNHTEKCIVFSGAGTLYVFRGGNVLPKSPSAFHRRKNFFNISPPE